MASGNIKGITIEFRGDTTQLGKALSSVNKEIRTTESALREIDKALKLDPGNLELVAQKETLLNKQIEQTKEKLALQKRAAEEAGKALKEGTISQEEYAKLTAEVAQTTSKLGSLEKEAKDTSQALNATGKEAKTTGDETKKAGDEAKKGGEKFEAFGKAAKAACAAAAAGAAAVSAAVVASTKALADFTVEGAHYADSLHTMSAVTGVSVERLQELQYAAKLVDVPVETLTGAMTKAEKAIASAAGGSKGAIENFEKLGVSFTDASGNMRDAESVLMDSVEALGKIENETERDTLAMSLFGKSAKDLNPLIKAGKGALEEYARQAHEVGYVMSDENLDAFQKFDDELVKLQNGTTAAKNALGTVLLPILTDLGGEGVDLLGDFTNAILGTNGDLSKVGDAVGGFVKNAVSAVSKYVPEFLSIAVTIVDSLVGAINENAEPILSAGMSIVMSLCSGILENAPQLIETIMSAVLLIVETVLTPENIESVLNAGVQVLLTIINGLVKTIPQLVPTIVNAILTIVKTITDKKNLNTVLTAATQILLAVIDGILSVLPDLIPTVIEILTTVVTTLLDPQNLDKVVKSAVAIITAVCDGIGSALPQLLPAVVEAITTITTELTKFENLEMIIKAALQIILALGEGLIKALPELLLSVVEITGSVIDEFAKMGTNLGTKALTWGKDMIANLINGIKNKFTDLKNTVGEAAGIVKDFLGFSEPKEGPLSNFHTFAPDMIDLFTEGIEDNLGEVRASVNDMAAIVAGGAQTAPDYTGQFTTLTDAVAAAGARGGVTPVVNVYIGQQKVDALVTTATNRANFTNGGH